MSHDPLILLRFDPLIDPTAAHEQIIRGLGILRGMEYIPGIDSAKKKNRELLEHIAVSRYLDCLRHHGYILRYSTIPNSTYTPFKSVKAQGKMMGVSPGFPDIASILYEQVSSGKIKTAYIELKQYAAGSADKNQKAWIEDLNRAEGSSAKVCHGFEEACEFLQDLILDDEIDLSK